MKITEIYASINGELPHIGTPTSIVRLSGCNLSCSYCDAPEEANLDMEPIEIYQRLLELSHRRVLITGGEPLLQRDDLAQLSKILYGAEFEVLYETNGTQAIAPFRPYGSFAVDVKLFDLPSFLVDNLAVMGPDDALKFVYQGNKELYDAFEFVDRHVHPMAQYQVVFSPTDVANPYMSEILAFAQKHPFLDVRLQAQLHKVLGVA